MIGLVSPPVETPPMTLKRALTLYGVTTLLLLVVSGIFVAVHGPRNINIPMLSVTISLLAVLAPTVIASFWPREKAPGALPSFRRVPGLVLAGVALASLPLYMVFAGLQVGLIKLLPITMDKGLVAPLTATGPLSFMWIWFAIALLPAVTEELLYRGALQRTLVTRMGIAWGLPVAAFLFSLAHLEPAGFLSRVLMGLWFGYLFWRTGSLWPGVVAHVLNNTWGVALANWHMLIEGLLPVVAVVAALALLGSAMCFRAARFWPWLSPGGEGDGGVRFVQMSMPEPPKTPDKRE